MTLRERIQSEITAAMRSGDALRRDTLRMAESAIYNAEKRARRASDDAEVTNVLAREVKTRRESVEAFRKGGRDELAAKEEAEIAILATFLPEQLGEAEVAALIEQAIAETGASGPADMGNTMGWLAPRTKGRADGRLLSQAVSKALAARAAGAATAGGS